MELLLVDDHGLFRDGMVLLLQQLESDVTVWQAGDGEQALTHLTRDLDLAIIDYQLPDINGINLLQKIKQHSPATPVVIMSGHDDLAMIKLALQHGASGFIPKTLGSDEIKDALLLILDGAFYVPPFIIKQISSSQVEEQQYSDLAQLAQLARRLINEKPWNDKSTESNEQNNLQTTQALHTVLDGMEQQQEQLRQYAFYDSLTGLPNRRLFDERLQQALKNTRRKQSLLALASIDLDKFKLVNDSLGHDIGDDLLKYIAEKLQQYIREVDTVARLGGDEFMVILNEVSDQATAERVIKEMLQQLSQPTHIGPHPITPSFSMGIALSQGDDSAESLMKKADIALYQAKNAGRNTFRFYS